jgi:hypothetical protein
LSALCFESRITADAASALSPFCFAEPIACSWVSIYATKASDVDPTLLRKSRYAARSRSDSPDGQYSRIRSMRALPLALPGRAVCARALVRKRFVSSQGRATTRYGCTR